MRTADRLPEGAETAAGGAPDDGGERQQDEDAEIQRHHTGQHQASTGQSCPRGSRLPPGERRVQGLTPLSRSILATTPFWGSKNLVSTDGQLPRLRMVK